VREGGPERAHPENAILLSARPGESIRLQAFPDVEIAVTGAVG
jgi:hypothetical protein